MQYFSDNFIYGIYTCRLLSSVLNGAEPVAMKVCRLRACTLFKMNCDLSNHVNRIMAITKVKVNK